MGRLLFLMAILLFAAGCTEEGASNESHAEATGGKASFQIPEKETYMNNPQATDDQSLTRPGDTTEDEDGQLTLQKMKKMERFKEIGPLHMAIKDVKVLSYSPSPDLVDFFHGYSDTETNFNYVKFTVAVKHTGSESVNFAPVELLETSTGEKKDFQEDFYLEKLYGEYAPGEVRTGEMGFVLNETPLSDLESLTISTSDVLGKDQEVRAEGKSLNIVFTEL